MARAKTTAGGGGATCVSMVIVQFWHARTAAKCMVSVKMSYFAIDFECEMPYPLAPPQGWEAQVRSLKKVASN
jgi:hypothetical protein